MVANPGMKKGLVPALHTATAFPPARGLIQTCAGGNIVLKNRLSNGGRWFIKIGGAS